MPINDNGGAGFPDVNSILVADGVRGTTDGILLPNDGPPNEQAADLAERTKNNQNRIVINEFNIVILQATQTQVLADVVQLQTDVVNIQNQADSNTVKANANTANISTLDGRISANDLDLITKLEKGGDTMTGDLTIAPTLKLRTDKITDAGDGKLFIDTPLKLSALDFSTGLKRSHLTFQTGTSGGAITFANITIPYANLIGYNMIIKSVGIALDGTIETASKNFGNEVSDLGGTQMSFFCILNAAMDSAFFNQPVHVLIHHT